MTAWGSVFMFSQWLPDQICCVYKMETLFLTASIENSDGGVGGGDAPAGISLLPVILVSNNVSMDAPAGWTPRSAACRPWLLILKLNQHARLLLLVLTLSLRPRGNILTTEVIFPDPCLTIALLFPMCLSILASPKAHDLILKFCKVLT